MSLQNVLKNILLFSKLEESQLEQLIASGKVCSVEKGHVIFHEGTPADSLYVILKGVVTIFKRNSHGEEVALNTKGKGNFFGELSLMDGDLRSATVAAIQPSEFFILEREAFHSLLSRSPQIISYIVTSLAKDIRKTSEKIFRDELNGQKLQAEVEIQRHKTISQMVAGVAHEINTPLGIIKTASDLMYNAVQGKTKEQLTDEELEDLQEASLLIQRSIDRAHHLIESFKKTSVHQITGSLEQVSLKETIEEIIYLFRISAKQARMTIEIKNAIPEREDTWKGYPGYLSQIMLNLLSNIERYAYPNRQGGKVNIELSIITKKKIKFYLLRVQDFGCGIPKKDQQHVFDAFFTTGRGRGGTGLGMTIVHNLVTQALKGNIVIDSLPNKGTTVSITLPQSIDGPSH